MKVNVKGLVFVGAAAAILLSAGAANAAKTARSSDASGIVTSQKYSDEKYEYWSEKVDGTVKGSDLVTAATNENKYPSMASMKEYTNPSTATSGELVTYNPTGLLGSTHIVTRAESITENGTYEWKDGYEGSETRVPSEKAVVKALDAVEASITQNQVDGSTYITVAPNLNGNKTVVAVDSTKIQTNNTAADNVNTSGHGSFLTTAATTQRKQTDTGVYQVSKGAEWENLSAAVAVGTKYMTETQDSNDVTTFAIDESKLVKTSANVNVTGNNGEGDRLVTSSAVQKKMDKSDNLPYVGVNNDWEKIEGDTASYTEVVRTGDATNGYKIQVKVPSSKVTTSGTDLAAATAANGNAADLVTAGAVKEYVASTGLGGTLNPMPDECGYAGAHCALVSSVVNGNIELTWTVMAGGEGTAPAPANQSQGG